MFRSPPRQWRWRCSKHWRQIVTEKQGRTGPLTTSFWVDFFPSESNHPLTCLLRRPPAQALYLTSSKTETIQWTTCWWWWRSLSDITNVVELASFQHLREWSRSERLVEGQLPVLLQPEESWYSNIPWLRFLWRDSPHVGQTRGLEKEPKGKKRIAATFSFHFHQSHVPSNA